MDNLISGFLVSFIVTYVSIPVIIRIARIKKLVDVPDARKIHKTPIPSLGGFGIFAGFLLALLVSVPFTHASGLQYFVAAAFIIYLVGLKDDVIIITPLAKLLGQLAAVFIVVYKGGIRIDSLHGIFGVQELPYVVSLLLTYFAFILIINAFNLIDGVDGLAGTLGIVSSLIFGIYFYFAHDTLYAVMGLSLVGGLSAFLLFNYTPAKIFMGDTGSMLIGLVNAILVLHFIKVADAPGAVLPVVSAPIIGCAILSVPLFDTVRVFTIRIFLHRRSPFSPDRNHIHHLLLDCGFSHPITTLSLAAFNLGVIMLAFALRNTGNHALLFGLIVTNLSFVGLIAYFRQPRKLFVIMKRIPLARSSSEGALAGAVPLKRHRKQKGIVPPVTMQPVFSLEEE
jgi:UDP-GlcNAc:undecaprenyl-phosphate GlcNAc-1-phosphate transferase